jgi:uncharacterized protein (DUF2345 family)
MTQIGEAVAVSINSEKASDAEYEETFQFVDPSGQPIGNVKYEILRSDGTSERGVSDARGRLPKEKHKKALKVRVRFLGIDRKG